MHGVDAFIEKQPGFAECGKLVMAYWLIRNENPNALSAHPKREDDWYSHLWRHMHTNAPTLGDVLQNRLHIITFNYDRSLEYALFLAMRNTYAGVDNTKALDIVSQIPVLHVYGTLGHLHLSRDGDGARTYSIKFGAAELKTAAESIKVIPDARSDDADFKTAKVWLEEADDIGVLGFGFDEANCERLGLSSVLKSCRDEGKGAKNIYASTFGLQPAEISTARLRMCGEFPWEPIGEKNLLFLRNTHLFE